MSCRPDKLSDPAGILRGMADQPQFSAKLSSPQRPAPASRTAPSSLLRERIDGATGW
jgi:hypothetical protein